MNTHTNRVIGLVVVIAVAMGLILSLGACSPTTPEPQPTVTVTQEPTPEPSSPSDSDFDYDDTLTVLLVDVFEENWASMTRSERTGACAYAANYPADATKVMKKSLKAEGLYGHDLDVGVEAWWDFLIEHC